MNSLRLIGLALATAVVLAFPAHAAVVPATSDQVVTASSDHCISLVEGALVSEFAIVKSNCDAVLADLTGLCLAPASDRAVQPERLVLIIPAALDTACAAMRPSPPG